MPHDEQPSTRDLDRIIEQLEVPTSHYERAVDRYTSIGNWMSREESTVRKFYPRVRCQGSFRLGTAIRPLSGDDDYDLDAVVELTDLAHDDLSQEGLKRLVGGEVVAYAKGNGIKAPPEEMKRVWRLRYADGVSFHVDLLPAIPELTRFKQALVELGVPAELAEGAISITCQEHPQYEVVCEEWPHSNPAGYAQWFESRMRSVAEAAIRDLVESRAYASVEDVPTYEWKTPLQRAIQILKRHRDHMFADATDVKPISIIITTLAGHAYEGERDVLQALSSILEKMPSLIRPTAPRVPNPVDPAEDFADKWAKNPALERNFRAWHARARVDLGRFRENLSAGVLREHASAAFGVTLPQDPRSVVRAAPAAVVAPTVISAPPRPWGSQRP